MCKYLIYVEKSYLHELQKLFQIVHHTIMFYIILAFDCEQCPLHAPGQSLQLVRRQAY